MAYVGGVGYGASTSLDRPSSNTPGGDPGQNYYTSHDYPQAAAGGGVNQFPMSNSLLNNIYSGWYNTQYLPNQMFQQAQLDQLGNQQGLAYAQGDLSTRMANQNAGFSMQDIGLSREGLGVQQGALARQMGLLPQEYGILQNQYGLQERQAWQGAGEQQQRLKSQEVTSGIGGAEGQAIQRHEVGTHLGNALEGIGYQRQQSALDFQEKQAQQKDADKMLGIQAKRLGLSEDEVRSRLQNSLDQIGISTNVSVDQILSEMYKVGQGGLSVFQPLFGALAQAQGITIPSTTG